MAAQASTSPARFVRNNECWSQTKREAFAYTGDIATLAGPDGSHFLGKDEPNIVIGFDSTGTHNIGRDIRSIQFVWSRTNPARPIISASAMGRWTQSRQPEQTLNGQLNGYAVGMVKSEIPASNFLNVVASTSPDDFNINFNKATNTLFANLTVHSDILGGGDGATSAYHIGFGDPQTPANKSAYIDDVHYAAIETPGGTSVYNNSGYAYDNADSTAYLASGEQLGVTNFFQETFTTVNPDGTRPFCDNCDFLQWGAWGARFGFGNQSTSNFTDNVHLGWWVAGDSTLSSDAFSEASTPSTMGMYRTRHQVGRLYAAHLA